jgi:hypothetical protein
MIKSEIVLNATSMITALIAIFYLARIILKIGGSIGVMLKFLIAGIFLAVFVNAGFELAMAFGAISGGFANTVTAVLLTLGSVAFIIGASIGIKSIE